MDLHRKIAGAGKIEKWQDESMTAKARFTQADITRALRAVKASGFASAKLTIQLDGTIVIFATDADLSGCENPWVADANEWSDLDV